MPPRTPPVIPGSTQNKNAAICVGQGRRAGPTAANTLMSSIKISQRILLDTDLIEFICNENEKSVPHLVGN